MGSLGFSCYRPLGGKKLAPVLGLRQGPSHFTRPGYRSSFNPASRTWGWACVPTFYTQSVAPQPLVTASVGKGCIVSRIGCDFHVVAQGWFD